MIHAVSRLWAVIGSLTLFFSVPGLCAETTPIYDPWDVVRRPSPEDWTALAQFNGAFTREEFERRLRRYYDPSGGMDPYLEITDRSVKVYEKPGRSGAVLADIAFTPERTVIFPPHREFRTPLEYQMTRPKGVLPLAGLNIAIDPADIGGAWGRMEDRSSFFRGYGLIQEGDLNLLVGHNLRACLEAYGARVMLVRDSIHPVAGLEIEQVLEVTGYIMKNRPQLMPSSYSKRARGLPQNSPRRFRIGAEAMLTKTIETRARAARIRQVMKPDLVIVLQHNATPASARAGLARINRNIFFVHGAYTKKELEEIYQRQRLMYKLFADVLPTETLVATRIARRFKEATGFPPVMYGDTATTRMVRPGEYFVVARNIAVNREHFGPVVVTEPYFMNQSTTLRRLLAGDYDGRRQVAGEERISIYKEYANCVAEGILDAYAPGWKKTQ
ncbi:MAG: hypothetical protein SFY92_02500 [Verrucomicrobiae bacterium]|nr:hypothetical protein [Verrucomicrobiae bacterium]